jgi:histidyl-tRNA synthetase
MEERSMFPPEIADRAPADVMVTISDDQTVAESLKLASYLRSAGLRVAVYPEADRLGKQLKYAVTINVQHVCILAAPDIAAGKVTLKDLQTGEQQTVNRDQIPFLTRNTGETENTGQA